MPEIEPQASPSSPPRSCAAAGSRSAPARRLDAVEEDAATLSTGERIPTRTVCWTAGVAPPPLVRELGLAARRGRPDRGRADAAREGPREHLGDRRRRRRAGPGRRAASARRRRRRSTRCARAGSSPTTWPRRSATGSRGRSATRRAACSWTWAATRRSSRRRSCASAASRPGSRARTYHMLVMPGFGRKLRLVADWTVGLFFGRGSAELGQLGHPQALEAPPTAAELARARRRSWPTTPSSPSARAPRGTWRPRSRSPSARCTTSPCARA